MNIWYSLILHYRMFVNSVITACVQMKYPRIQISKVYVRSKYPSIRISKVYVFDFSLFKIMSMYLKLSVIQKLLTLKSNSLITRYITYVNVVSSTRLLSLFSFTKSVIIYKHVLFIIIFILPWQILYAV